MSYDTREAALKLAVAAKHDDDDDAIVTAARKFDQFLQGEQTEAQPTAITGDGATFDES